jgi:hypothetical protein
MFKYICIAIFIISCTHVSNSTSYPTPQSKEDCMQLFVDVLAIQNRRSSASNDMGRHTAQFNGGNMSVSKYRKKYEKWQREERIMRASVTHMYDLGYEFGCFDENKVWEEDSD